MSAFPSLDALNAALADRVEELAAELVGGGPDKHGQEWIAANRKKGGPGDSLMIRLAGDRRGSWYWHARGIGGDLVGLIAVLVTSHDMRSAMTWAGDWLGNRPLPDAVERHRRREAQAQRQSESERRRQANAMHFARATFDAARADVLGTPVEAYLFGRGITLRRFTHVPPCLRFAPKLRHPDLGRALPAMVAAISNQRSEVVAIQRIWLVKREGNWDRVRKDREGVDGKMSLGPCRGHCIHLWNGEHVDSVTGEIIAGVTWSGQHGARELHACEGIEDGLSLVELDPRRCIVVTAGVANFAALELPRNVCRLTWWADADWESNDAVLEALAAGKETHQAAGRAVDFLAPPVGDRDWNAAHRRVQRSPHHDG